MGAKFTHEFVKIGNHPEVSNAFRMMVEVQNDPAKKQLYQRRQSALVKIIGKKAFRPGSGGNTEVTVEAVINYLQHPMVETEPKIRKFPTKDYEYICIPTKQKGRARNSVFERNLGPAVGSDEELKYRLDLSSRGRNYSNAALLSKEKIEHFRDPVYKGTFVVIVGKSDESWEAVVVDGPAQAIVLAEFYEREGMPNPVLRKRLARKIQLTKNRIQSEQDDLAGYEKELAKLGDGS